MSTYPRALDGGGGYSRTPQDVVDLWFQRRKDRSPIITQMSAIRDQVNGDVIVPLPELDKNEKSFVANLIQQGLDEHARRIAEVMPNLTCPPGDPRKPGSVTRADIRRKANLGWWEENKVPRIMRRRARHLIGYSQSPVMIRPDFDREIPTWHLRNPLDSFPAPCVNPDDLTPHDNITAVLKPYSWLRRAYPDAIGVAPRNCHPDLMLTVLEYDDAEQWMSVVVGSAAAPGVQPLALLEQIPNRAEICLSVVPGRITLDRLVGQFDGVLGMYQMQAKLMALEVLAVQKGVFPDTYLISRPNETAELVGGYHPGYTGEINEVRGGDIKEVTVNPSFAAVQAIDRLERGVRVGAGIPADFSGESASNVRTGRRGDAILSATVDSSLAEAQETFGASLEEENRRATKIARAYFGNRAKSFHVRWKGAKGHVTYTPNKDFDSDYTQVTYASPGSDMNNLVTSTGQMIGVGLMSLETGRRIIPMIDDADYEADRVLSEGLERAMLESLQQQAAQGQIPPGDVAKIVRLVKQENKDFAAAVEQVQAEAQERQAAVDAQGQSTAVDPMSPEAQPGLAIPGAGAEAGVAVGEAPTALGNLSSMLHDMRSSGAGAGA